MCESAFAKPKGVVTNECDQAHSELFAVTVFRRHWRATEERNHRLPREERTAESCTLVASTHPVRKERGQGSGTPGAKEGEATADWRVE